MYARDFTLIATPIGMIRVSGNVEVIETIAIEAGPASAFSAPTGGALAEAADQLAAYFARRLTLFDLPIQPLAGARGTALREAILAIPFGETRSYGALARSIGSGARAIGQACARNPLPIVIPCHRITNADGSLGAYSGGNGPRTKRWLLDFEQQLGGDLIARASA